MATVVFTGWALESSGVAVITTHGHDGSERTTHVWYVMRDGALWLEAGAPENGWYQDVLERPELTLARADEARESQVPEAFSAQPSPEDSAAIRSLLRQKYGLRDRWVGLFVDGSRSIAVRLVPRAGP